jgi:hypothetical protein
MPEYLAPGVYVEEVSFRSKSIEGVSTTTTGLIGPTRYGPIDLPPDILTSLGDFERTYGDGQPLSFGDAGAMDNYLWHAVRAFFDNGGKRLYVMRVFRARAGSDGRAKFVLNGDGSTTRPLAVKARFPGAAGNTTVRLTLRLSQNVLGGDEANKTVGGLAPYDTVWVSDLTSPVGPAGSGRAYVAKRELDSTTKRERWVFVRGGETLLLSDLHPNLDPALSDQIRIITVTVMVFPADPNELPQVWSDLPLDPGHKLFGEPDSLLAKFSVRPNNRALELTLPLIIEANQPNTQPMRDGLDVLSAIEDTSVQLFSRSLLGTFNNPQASDLDRSLTIRLTDGNDGNRPTATEYEGEARDDRNIKTGLKALEDLEDISIIAAPGSTARYEKEYKAQASTILNLLIGHAERMRYRIAVLDAGDGQTIQQVRALRGRLDSKYAAFYYPWVKILDPITRTEIHQPPSGFVAGIYARNDITRAVYKAPANEVVNLAIGFEQMLNKAQQDVLNPEGINCFRFFEGRGYRLWGGRTISSDPEWKYVNLRRYFAYLERSIDKGTQWAVFEPNGELLWANVRRTIEDFLLNEWMNGALLGDKPEKAYFVRCDRSTMTQNDLDNGRLVALIGVAPLRPAEFVIFRIGQWTADKRT